jgi:hypothetical protein
MVNFFYAVQNDGLSFSNNLKNLNNLKIKIQNSSMTGQTTHTSIIYGLELHVRVYVSGAWSWILFSSLYFLKARFSYHDQIYIFFNFF